MSNHRLLLETPRFRVLQADGSPATGGSPPVYVDHQGAVVVLPLLADGRVCLIRNRRRAVGRELIEAPAGTLEPGESPEVTARRELEEETGYRAAAISALPPFFLSPGILNERMHAYVATELTAGEPRREPGEEIQNLVLPWAEAVDKVRRGEIEDAKTIAVLLYWQCFQPPSR